MIRYKARDCYIHRKIIDDDFLVPVGQQVIKKNGIVLMNETAAFLWNEIREEKTVEELCAALAGEYEVKDENIREDVVGFIEYMLSLDAIETIEHI